MVVWLNIACNPDIVAHGHLTAVSLCLHAGVGIFEQQTSFLGLLLIHVTVFGLLIVRNNKSLPNLRNLADEAFFYDRQWAASWEGQERPSETERS